MDWSQRDFDLFDEKEDSNVSASRSSSKVILLDRTQVEKLTTNLHSGKARVGRQPLQLRIYRQIVNRSSSGAKVKHDPPPTLSTHTSGKRKRKL